MTAFWIWGSAALVYGLFRAWYDNWRGPLSAAEVEKYMHKAAEIAPQDATGSKTDSEILRKFLSEDDGGEFFMLNLVKVTPGMIAHPDTGEMMPGVKMLSLYSDPFIKRLFGRGGHPAIVGRKIAGYVDSWNVSPDPGWTIMGYMRYRSRRDLAELAFDPSFKDIHKYKLLGIAATFSFPTKPVIMAMISPRIWMGLVLALAAALVQIAALSV
jgi:hypothetical protein